MLYFNTLTKANKQSTENKARRVATTVEPLEREREREREGHKYRDDGAVGVSIETPML